MKSGKAVIKKSINKGITLGDDGYYHITLETEETRGLNAGIYKYDIEINVKSNDKLYVKTILDGDITLLQDITTKEDY